MLLDVTPMNSSHLSECVTCMLSVCARTCGVLVKISPGGSKYSFLLDSAQLQLNGLHRRELIS